MSWGKIFSCWLCDRSLSTLDGIGWYCCDTRWCQYDFELLAIAKLHVIVPLGREASRGDQIENAAYFVKKKAMQKTFKKAIWPWIVWKKLSHLLSHKEDYQAKMKASKELKSLADFINCWKKIYHKESKCQKIRKMRTKKPSKNWKSYQNGRNETKNI